MSVTAELDNFVAASEFSAPHFVNDTCGEDAFRIIQHAKSGVSLTGDTMFNIREDMAAHGYAVQGGTTMSALCDYFSKVQGLDVVEANPYGSSFDAIHQTLLDHAGRDGIVIEVEHASRLTDSEPGVNRHYVAIGGIHPVKGYLVGNGDSLQSLAQDGGHGKIVPCVWMDKDVIAAAGPSACAVIRGLSYTTDLSAGAVAAPQFSLNSEGGLTGDANQAPQESANSGSGGAQDSQEQAQAPSQASTQEVAAVAGLPLFFDSSNVAAVKASLVLLRQQLATFAGQLEAIVASLPEPFRS